MMCRECGAGGAHDVGELVHEARGCHAVSQVLFALGRIQDRRAAAGVGVGEDWRDHVVQSGQCADPPCHREIGCDEHQGDDPCGLSILSRGAPASILGGQYGGEAAAHRQADEGDGVVLAAERGELGAGGVEPVGGAGAGPFTECAAVAGEERDADGPAAIVQVRGRDGRVSGACHRSRGAGARRVAGGGARARLGRSMGPAPMMIPPGPSWRRDWRSCWERANRARRRKSRCNGRERGGPGQYGNAHDGQYTTRERPQSLSDRAGLTVRGNPETVGGQSSNGPCEACALRGPVHGFVGQLERAPVHGGHEGSPAIRAWRRGDGLRKRGDGVFGRHCETAMNHCGS